MKNNTIKIINGYLIYDILMVIALLALYILKDEKTSINAFALFVLLASAALFLQAKFGKTQVSNRTGGTIYAKRERGADVLDVPTMEAKSNIDGVKVGGKVYKLPDGVHATITKNGKLLVDSLFGSLLYKVGGGKLTAPPDDDWKALFER